MEQVLTEQITHNLISDGYAVLRELIPPKMIQTALRRINFSLAEDGISVVETKLGKTLKYCTNILEHPDIMSLFHESDLYDLSQNFFGEGGFHPIKRSQIALRFPGSEHDDSVPHIDNLPTPWSSFTKENFRTFDLLIGIFLSDVGHQNAGNLTIWPRSHVQLESYWREFGPDRIFLGMPSIDYSAPFQLQAQPGDAVICHYQLAHGVAHNLSPNIRYAVYFRVRSLVNTDWRVSLTNLWGNWPGVHKFLSVHKSRE